MLIVTLQTSIQDELTKRGYSHDAGTFCHLMQKFSLVLGVSQILLWPNILLSWL
jgi:hypothetical protein